MYFFQLLVGIIGIRFSPRDLGLEPGEADSLQQPHVTAHLHSGQWSQNPFIPQLHFQTSKLTIELRVK
jgi:hypothetical protein